jgi:glycine betaine catabolism B
MNVTLDQIEQVGPHVQTFWFRPNHMPHYTAGQFIELTVPHANPDERRERHWFTLSSSPTEERLAITTVFASDRSSTFKQALLQLQPGSSLHMSEPMGDFVLPMNKTIPLLFVAGGIGITPVRSMIKWLHDNSQQRHIQLLYGVSSRENLLFTDLFTTYDLTPTYIVSHPDTAWEGEAGHVTTERIMQCINGNPHMLIYISAPEPMTEQLVKELLARGIPTSRLVTDYFPGYPSV